MRFIKIFFLLLIVVFINSCSDRKIDASKMSKETIKYLQDLEILDKNEEVIYFYTALRLKVSGNIITDKRVASYWQYNSDEDYIKFALYPEIKSISITYGDGFEKTSSFNIEKNNGEKFEVYFNGKKEEIDKIYSEVLKLWKNKEQIFNEP